MKCMTALFSVFGILAASGVIAQSPFQRLDVVSGDYSGLVGAQTAANGPEFGFSVAVSGEWMAVGAPATIAGGVGWGAVFMFRNQGDEWELMQRIMVAGVGQDRRCGHSVALSGSYLVFGCPGRGTSFKNPDNEAGSTRIYKRNAN